MTFDSSTSASAFKRDFTPLSPPGSYSLDSDGLKLFLDKPDGKIARKGHTNTRVADGATFNSTFTVRYAKVTYAFSGPAVPGVVTAAILLAPERDEIDIELLGGDASHWQTNVFAPARSEDQPLYGAFSSVQNYPHSPKSVASTHSYAIDWSPDRIVWSVDGSQVRTLLKADTMKNGALHYPSHPSRLQFGIWDASDQEGTAEWAHGPIDWDTAPKRTAAVFASVQVECPY
ncbi:glycoside hydrolase [Lentinus brumalis]|uniref:Glycoside hydrolase n=1 Tax=Lentinus brumalis TaxID=2498619 RepID=A0A371D3S8_9APHY|nr:glycoside hydrolase [Polyporus brumalis]